MVIDVNLLLQMFFWSGTILTVIARFLNIKKLWYCFIFWIFGSTVMCIQGAYLNQPNIVMYQIVYLMFNIWGLIEWHKAANNKRGPRR